MRVYLGTKFSTQVRRTALFQMQLSTSVLNLVAVDSLSILPGYCLFFFLRQGVPNVGAESGVSGRARVLPGTLAHALVLVVPHSSLPAGHKASPMMDEHINENMYYSTYRPLVGHF